MLDDLIYCQNDIHTVFCVDILLIFIGHLGALGVRRADDTSRRSFELFVKYHLDSVEPLVIVTGKANDMGSKITIRIVALGIL